jgi:hypothetical protein
MPRFDFSHFDVNGGAVYSADHEPWNSVSITLPPGYFHNVRPVLKEWPTAINVPDFIVTPATPDSVAT